MHRHLYDCILLCEPTERLTVAFLFGIFSQFAPISTLFLFPHLSRVKTQWLGDHVLSVLSIKSAILEDSGNYSCLLPASNHSDTARLTVLNGRCPFIFFVIKK